jgi:hypothetical protein
MARMMAGAAIKTMTRACTICTISVGNAGHRLHPGAGAQDAKQQLAPHTPAGWLLPSRARAMESKP